MNSKLSVDSVVSGIYTNFYGLTLKEGLPMKSTNKTKFIGLCDKKATEMSEAERTFFFSEITRLRLMNSEDKGKEPGASDMLDKVTIEHLGIRYKIT